MQAKEGGGFCDNKTVWRSHGAEKQGLRRRRRIEWKYDRGRMDL
jgi:hypothetical protein